MEVTDRWSQQDHIPNHLQRAEIKFWSYPTGLPPPNTKAATKRSVHKSYEQKWWQRDISGAVQPWLEKKLWCRLYSERTGCIRSQTSHTPGELPTGVPVERGWMPSPSPQNTCGKHIVQIPMDRQGPCWGCKVDIGAHSWYTVFLPETEVRICGAPSCPVPWIDLTREKSVPPIVSTHPRVLTFKKWNPYPGLLI